jgi:hypothetical protein
MEHSGLPPPDILAAWEAAVAKLVDRGQGPSQHVNAGSKAGSRASRAGPPGLGRCPEPLAVDVHVTHALHCECECFKPPDVDVVYHIMHFFKR